MNTIHLSTKDLPEQSRPYERVRKLGPEALSDAELLAVILRSGTKDLTSVDIGQLLLKDRQKSLLNLYEYDYSEYMRFPGIGEVKAVELLCLAEISKRLTGLSRRKDCILNNPSSIATYYMESMRHLKNEQVMLAMFDQKGMLLKDRLLSLGSATCSIISARDIFIEAIKSAAVYIVVLHNHPSGNPFPSGHDNEFTVRLRDAGEVMDIPLRDHIIIGDNIYYSYADHGLL